MKNSKVIALVLCVLLVGCVSNAVKSEVDREYRAQYTYGARVGNWFVDRFNDLFDVVQVDFSFGPGVLANVHATEFGQLGMGWYDGANIGLRERAVGVWESTRQEYGFGPFYHLDVNRVPVAGVARLFDHAYDYTGWDLLEAPTWKEDERHWLDVGGSLHLIVLGANANVGVFELGDFVFGLNPLGLIFTLLNYNDPIWDFMSDDTWSQIRLQLEQEEGLGD